MPGQFGVRSRALDGGGATRLLLHALPAPDRSPLLSEQPEENGQDRAEQQTSNDREIKTKVAFAVMNVSRQPAEPAAAKPRPDQQSYSGRHQAEDKEDFARFIHRWS